MRMLVVGDGGDLPWYSSFCRKVPTQLSLSAYLPHLSKLLAIVIKRSNVNNNDQNQPTNPSISMEMLVENGSRHTLAFLSSYEVFSPRSRLALSSADF
jgi:hypothetical protein